MGTPSDHLSRLLFASARPFTTRCVIAELKKLGGSFSETVLAARKVDSAKCNHEPLKSASECLEDLIEGGNPEHFWVATQDAELRKKLRQVPAVAIILAQNNFLVLEPPSEKQQAVARSIEAQRTHANEKEFQIIEAREKKKNALLEARRELEEATEDGTEGMRKEASSMLVVKDSGLEGNLDTHKWRKSLRVMDGPQFKRKRAKGPNPLSVKKKSKKSMNVEKIVQRQGEAGGATAGALGNRKRRHHKRKTVTVE